MDQLDAITLLYLSEKLDGTEPLLDCAHTFQQTRAELKTALEKEESNRLTNTINNGSFHF